MTHPGAPLSAELSAGFTVIELDRIQRACELAAHLHAGQLRNSGDPYITHPVAVAEIAAPLGLDCDIVLVHPFVPATASRNRALLPAVASSVLVLAEYLNCCSGAYERITIAKLAIGYCVICKMLTAGIAKQAPEND